MTKATIHRTPNITTAKAKIALPVTVKIKPVRTLPPGLSLPFIALTAIVCFMGKIVFKCTKPKERKEETKVFVTDGRNAHSASACNYFWRKEKLEENLIAFEPLGGWHGNHTNQSTISALEWLYYQDHLLGGMGCVRHVHNGGEVQVLTPSESYHVDGFDEKTNTVFEFYGCWYQGCPHRFKPYRDVRRNCHSDQSVNEVYDATLKKSRHATPSRVCSDGKVGI